MPSLPLAARCSPWAFAGAASHAHLSVGGFTGIAQVLNLYFPVLPVGITTLVMNVPLFILGLKLLGRRLLVSSLYAMAVSSLTIDGVNAPVYLPGSGSGAGGGVRRRALRRCQRLHARPGGHHRRHGAEPYC